jgi:hypothetical protein
MNEFPFQNFTPPESLSKNAKPVYVCREAMEVQTSPFRGTKPPKIA